jgi:hypothetical protein
LEGERQVAVIPYTPLTLSLATRMAKRAGRIGIEIALIRPDGVVKYMKK